MLEELAALLDLNYLSDLRMGNGRKLLSYFESYDITRFSVDSYSNLAEYMFGEKCEFRDHGHVKSYFIEKLNK